MHARTIGFVAIGPGIKNALLKLCLFVMTRQFWEHTHPYPKCFFSVKNEGNNF